MHLEKILIEIAVLILPSLLSSGPNILDEHTSMCLYTCKEQ